MGNSHQRLARFLGGICWIEMFAEDQVGWGEVAQEAFEGLGEKLLIKTGNCLY